MDIKVPKGMKSPTVVIVSGGTMTGDEKSNHNHEKRMDMLEKKLDQQYKKTTNSGYDPKEYVKSIDQLQKSFSKKLERVITQNKYAMSSQNSKLLDALKKTVSKVKVIKEESDGSELKTFIKKIDSLEDAIRKISLKNKNLKVSTKVNLDSSFDKLFERMEKAIKSARPRMSPSPS